MVLSVSERMIEMNLSFVTVCWNTTKPTAAKTNRQMQIWRMDIGGFGGGGERGVLGILLQSEDHHQHSRQKHGSKENLNL